MLAQTRGWLQSLVDRTTSWLLGFPPETCNFKITALKIPIGDELSRIELAADLYQPILKNSKPAGTILIRTPYGRKFLGAMGAARPFAARGYQVLNVSCRGTFGSGGEFDPFRNEVEDGKAVVQWMRKQAWYTGSFATIGGSYLGFNQWALLCDPPKDMVAAVISVGPHDASRSWWGSGALNFDVIGWANLIVLQEKAWGKFLVLMSSKKVRAVLDKMPLVQSVDDYFKGGAPWLNRIMARSDVKDPYYKPTQLYEALERADIPILLVTGWYDLFVDQTIEQYTRLKERGCTVALTAGPWAHIKVGISSISNYQTWTWIEDHLAGRPNKFKREMVQYYVTGTDQWRYADRWPPSTTTYPLNLEIGQQLLIKKLSSQTESSTFIFDPQDPTPVVGGNTLLSGGQKDDSALAARPDVLTFTTDPLPSDLEVCGNVTVELSHATNNTFADIFVRVSEVDNKGKSSNITEKFKRLDPDRKEGSVKLTLNPCAHRFLKGKRIRLYVAGGCHPHYARNLGAPNHDNTGSEMRSVTHTVFYGDGVDSKIILPVVTDRPPPRPVLVPSLG